MYRTAPFIRLGHTIDNILTEHPAVFDELVRFGRTDNPWFTAESIRLALTSISKKMLRGDKLDQWLSDYPYPEGFKSKNVGIIMAGNIPLVGFLDLLCVCVAGHNAYVKSSSKDSVLMSYAIKALSHYDHSLVIRPLTDDSPLDAVIATGSDNTNRYFKNQYGNIPRLLRGSRTSVAVLTGGESVADLRGLSHDVFDYFGMGCRSVAKIFVPEGYDNTKLTDILKARNITLSNYLNAYRHHKAVLQMHDTAFRDGGFFTLRESAGFSQALPDLVYTPYRTLEEVQEWISVNDENLQCIVTTAFDHRRGVVFGEAQQPELWDYPDGKDVMAFLYTI